MIKLIALTLTLAAATLTTSFAGCPGSGCSKDTKDKKKETKEPAARVIEL